MSSLTNQFGVVVAVASTVLNFSLIDANTASAATFNFSYSFLSGETVSGKVDGDLQSNGDIVTNLSNLVAEYSGTPGTVFSFFAPFGARQFSLSGIGLNLYGFVNNPNTPISQTNFGFALTDGIFANSATLGTFLTESTSIGFPQGQEAKEFETFSSSRWRAAQTKDIPESSTVLSLSLLGLCFLGKKKLSRVA